MEAQKTLENIKFMLSKLGAVFDRIKSGTESIEDYNLLERIFKITGVPDDVVHSMYKNQGFSNWKQFYHFRRSGVGFDGEKRINRTIILIKDIVILVQLTYNSMANGLKVGIDEKG